MKLLTNQIKKTLPRLYEQDDKGNDAIVYVKFFTPDSSWTWYVLEGEPEGNDFTFFGFVDGLFPEYGYFRLSELEEVRGPLGLPIERDRWFDPQPIGKIKDAIYGRDSE